MIRRRWASGSGRVAESGPIPAHHGGWMWSSRPPLAPQNQSGGDATPTRPSRPPSSAPPRPDATRTAMACSCSSSRPGPGARSSRSSSAAGAAKLGLGAATLVPLAKARELALANRMLARSGGDPLPEKRHVQGVPTFAEATRRVLEQKRGGWGAGGTCTTDGGAWSGTCSPRRQPARLGGQHGRRAGEPRAHRARQGGDGPGCPVRCWSGRSRSTCGTTTPCDRVVPVLGPQNDTVTHRQALPHRDVAAAIETVRTSRSGSLPSSWRLSPRVDGRVVGKVRLATWTRWTQPGGCGTFRRYG